MEFGPSCFYSFLGVEKDCCKTLLAKAYRRKSLQFRPDKGGGAADFERLCKIFRVLSDDELRWIYDNYGDAAVDQQEHNSQPVMELEAPPPRGDEEEGQDHEGDG